MQGGIWLTTDAGISWTKQPSALYNTISESRPGFIHFFDANNGVTIGDPSSGYFEIYTINDGGANWVRVPSANVANPNTGEILYGAEHYDAFGNSVWFATSTGNIFRSTDKGYTWLKIQSPLVDFGNPYYGAHFAFKDQESGIMVGRDWHFYRSSNGGVFWESEFPDISTFRNENVVRVPQTPNTYFSWGEPYPTLPPGSSYTLDGGTTWLNIEEDMAPAITAKFYSPTVGYCTGFYLDDPTQLKFFRLADSLDRLLVNETFITQKEFIVSPNPTNGFVKILGKNINAISVFDALGKIIFESNYNAVNEVKLDLSNFQSGIYFAKIVGDRSFSTVKIIKN